MGKEMAGLGCRGLESAPGSVLLGALVRELQELRALLPAWK